MTTSAPRERVSAAVVEEVTAMTRWEERRASWVANWPVIVEPPQINNVGFSFSLVDVDEGIGTSNHFQRVIAAVRPATPRQEACSKERVGGIGRTVWAGTVTYCWKVPARESR